MIEYIKFNIIYDANMAFETRNVSTRNVSTQNVSTQNQTFVFAYNINYIVNT